jgi:hypothetical protein
MGLSVTTLTNVHVIVSLVALAAGIAVFVLMLRGRDHPALTPFFLASTIATTGTGFLFPIGDILPSHIVGLLSLAALVIAVAGYYAYRLTGAWRWIYVVAALTAFYLNCFVGVVQAFLKIDVLHALAPRGSEPAFIAAHILLLVLLAGLGIVAVRRFHPAVEVA